MTVTAQHKQYVESLPKWEIVRDCVAGSIAVKGRIGSGDGETTGVVTSSGTRYLPAPNPEDTSAENIARYRAYKQRANFVNFTGITKDGMLGLVFRKAPEIKLPDSIGYLEENANGGGMSLKQFAKDTLGDTEETGRYGILTDYPSAPEGLTQAQVESMELRATLVPYTAESIINWRTEVIGSAKMLTLVVLAEEVEEIDDDGFDTEVKKKYRVLRLVDGAYSQSIYDEDGKPEAVGIDINDNNEQIEVYEIYPTNAAGKEWDHIPFVFIGAQNNDETVDKPPLYDIADVNIAHYRNSADYEESSFMVGQPTTVVSGLDRGWADEFMPNGLMVGSRRAILLPAGSDAKLMQADPNQMPSKGMEEKEKQMVMIGARLIQDNGGVETAEAAKIRFSGQNSKLGSLVHNVSEGIEQSCKYALEFMQANPTDAMIDEVDVDLNDEFYEKTIDPQLLAQMIILGDRGVIADTDIRAMLRNGSIIERDDDEIEDEAEVKSPLPATATNVS